MPSQQNLGRVKNLRKHFEQIYILLACAIRNVKACVRSRRKKQDGFSFS